MTRRKLRVKGMKIMRLRSRGDSEHGARRMVAELQFFQGVLTVEVCKW